MLNPSACVLTVVSHLTAAGFESLNMTTFINSLVEKLLLNNDFLNETDVLIYSSLCESYLFIRTS